MADSLVFDFPDPTPHFDFDNFSHGSGSGGGGTLPSPPSTTNTKKSSKKGGRSLFKSRFMNKSANNNSKQQRPASSPVTNHRSPQNQRPTTTNGGDDSPLNKSLGDQSGTTATTASLSVGSASFSPSRSNNGGGKHTRVGSWDNTTTSSSSSRHHHHNGNNNNNSSSGRTSPRFEFTLDDSHTSSSPNMRKLTNTKQFHPYSNLTSNHHHMQPQQTTNPATTDSNLYTAYGLSSDRTAASGYFSEVSEFSFDRVTVDTERTGVSSNVSWNFLDGEVGGGGGLLGALGSGDEKDGVNSSVVEELLLDDDELLLTESNGGKRQMNVLTGEIHERCDQSVISEISEGIDGHDDRQGGRGRGEGMDFINSILMDKYNEGGGVVKGGSLGHGGSRASSPTMMQHQGPNHHHGMKNGTTTAGGAGSTATPTTASTTATPSLCKQSTVSTSANNSCGGEGCTPSSVASKKCKQRPKAHKKTENRSILQAIIQDIQFCGAYFCGFDTTVEDDGQLMDKKQDVLLQGGGGSPSKEARAKEMDSTFLGKFVMCAACPNLSL